MKSIDDIKRIAVLGAGTMGPGIAQIFAMGGHATALWTRSEETREKAKKTLKGSLETFADEGLLPKEAVESVCARVNFASSVSEAVRDADFIMETIVENRDAKTELFAEIDKFAKGDCIIASNTSALNVFEIVPPNRLPQAVIAHWYAPPQLIPLVEVVKSEAAPEEYLSTTVALLEKCGKTAVPMKKFIRGYIANRMQMCLNQEVFYLLDNGYCTPEDIDKAVKASFIPRAVVLGLCKRADFGGLDMTANNYKNKSYTLPPEVDMPATLKAHIDKGELGLKSGKGFYDYTGVDKQALLAKRDKQLFEIFKIAKKFMDDPV
ncbi:MAG: 3-hydroxyacyl-CoA dehydrogenase family protein [Clostridiales Family XIII bacterium]|jgi:3-hydroxyacyl-CoA dehydrogenase|nr:3-hydroxyacyl-CoA dehydrogenase family protein [Clostridiales Family XIII bacterium]